MRRFSTAFGTRTLALCMAALLPSFFSSATFANQVSGLDTAGYVYHEPPGNFFPGKYFESKAQFYLNKKDYRFALNMYELAGFWANKVAQYNAGLMYYNGLGVPVDRVRGVAWLGIAAEGHDNLADRALQMAYASLSEEEKQQANTIWHDLNKEYGDAVSVPRALRRFDQEAHSTTGSHLGFVGNLQVYEAGSLDSLGESGFHFYNRKSRELDKLIDKITGHVAVGAVVPLNVSNDVKANASQIPLAEPSTNPGH